MAPIRSNRKKSLNEGSMYPLKRKHNDNDDHERPEQIHRSSTNKEKSMCLLQQCFGLLTSQIWWRLLPIDDGYDDISVGIGIDWQYLLPLLVNTGLIKTKNSHIRQY